MTLLPFPLVKTGKATITVLDILGNRIKTEHFTGKEFRLEKASLQNGLYFVQITDDKNNVVTSKIILH